MNTGDKQKVKAGPTMFLMISLGLNLALALTAVKLRPHPALAPIAHQPILPVTDAAARQPSADLYAPAKIVTNRFRWQMLESTNYAQYAANLRGIGCPEKTVQAIVLAEIGRHHARLSRQVQTNLPFWTGGRKRRAALKAQADKQVVQAREEAALIRQLFGFEYDGDSLHTKHFDEQAVMRFMIGPTSEATFREIANTIAKYKTLKDELDRRTGNILTEADKAEVRKLAAAEQRELQALLTPAEWEEWRARSGAFQLVDLLGNSDLFEVAGLSAFEARHISLARSGDGLGPKFFDWDFPESDAEREQRDAQFTLAAAQILGTSRFTEFQRAQDKRFVELFTLARKDNLPRQSVDRVYEIRQLAVEEVQRIRSDTSLNEAERKRLFSEMQAQLQPAVSATLGAEAFRDYLRGGGVWITNLTKL